MTNNKTIKRAIENVVQNAKDKGSAIDKKFNLKCEKEIRGDLRIYDLFQNEEMIYTVIIADNWDWSEVDFGKNEVSKAMKAEVKERITESKLYGFNDI